MNKVCLIQVCLTSTNQRRPSIQSSGYEGLSQLGAGECFFGGAHKCLMVGEGGCGGGRGWRREGVELHGGGARVS